MKRLYLLLLFSISLLTAGVVSVKADNVTVNGTSRSYNVIVPKDLGENRPLLIFCHGYNQDANWMQNSEFKNETVSMEAVCDTAKFVCVFPNGIDKSWDISGDRDINFVKAIIEEMVTKHHIDRKRVYLGGFSMGGMFTYHAMNKIPDLIAAFCPVSGYPMGGATADDNTRPIPILHIHGTGDGTCSFSGVQPALNVWISHNGCPTTANVISNYNGFSGAKLHVWGPGHGNVEVRLLELADKGHWICKEPQVYTGKEIWNFCKNYSMKEKTSPAVKITTPKAGGKFISFAPADGKRYPDITITADAEDPNGTVEKVEFYEGTTLLATCTSKPYEAVLTDATSGSHTLKVVATDNDGEKGTASITVTVQAPNTLLISTGFTEGNALPIGWTTFDSSERRSGYSNGYTSGCRVLQFTGSPRGFSYGLYFRNISGAAHQGWAKYGLPDGGNTLNLAPGHYTLKYKICNWNMANFGAVEVGIETLAGGSVASTIYTPNINIGNATGNSFATPEAQSFEFDITEQGSYAIAFYSATSEWSDGVIGYLILTANSYDTTGITTINHSKFVKDVCYDLQGRKISVSNSSSSPLRKGIYIKNGKKYLSY